MNDKQQLEAELQDAFNNGFVPKEIATYMQNSEHQGQLYVGENPDDDRIKVGYRIVNEGGETAHAFLYSLDEAEKFLKEYK